jgi:hypothetical protein
MFDNLRESADSSFYEEESNDLYKEPAAPAFKTASMPKRRRSSGNGTFLGMTGQQRFILSFMFMLTICIMGTVAMFLLGRMSF